MCCGKFLGASDDARLVIGRQAHRLRLVELRVLKCGQTQQSVSKAGGQTVFGDIDLIAEDQVRARSAAVRRSVVPCAGATAATSRVGHRHLRLHKANANRRGLAFCLANDLLDRLAGRSCESPTRIPIDRDRAPNARQRKRCCRFRGVVSAAATQSDCRIRPVAACPDSGKKRSYESSPMSGRRSIVSVSRCEPSFRASAAGIASIEEDPDVPAVAGARPLQALRGHSSDGMSPETLARLPASAPCRNRPPGRSTFHPGASDRRP